MSFPRGPGFSNALTENDMSKEETESHTDSTNMHNDTKEGMDEEVQEVMKDNLELMLEVVMKIREDEEFARNIYANCPRLQDLLEQHPDLRPIFEDPNLVRINFEQVYRDAGGVLPEDEPKKVTCLSKVVNHPLFKVFRFFLLIKKMVNCVMGGGFAMIKGCFAGLCFEEAADQIGDFDGDGDMDQHESSPQNQANREQLNAAADHMEEPEVQEHMNELLESNDPDQLAEAIENDPELKALRDSNPLCAELMADPDTMRILVDPDNLRALGECPDLIEQDFASPDWSPPDIEVGGDGMDVDVDADAEVDAEPAEGEEGEGEEEEEEGMADDFEMGEQDNKNAANKSKGKAKNQKQKKEGGGGGGGASGFLGSLGAGITDMVAGELIGVTMGDLMGGGDDLGGLEEVEDIPTNDLADAAESAGDHAASAADNAAGAANRLAQTSEMLLSDDTFDNLDNFETGLDGIEDTHDDRAAGAAGTDVDAADGDKGENRNASRAKAGAIGAAGGLAIHAASSGRPRGAGDEEPKEGKALEDDEEKEEEEKPKKSRFGFVGNMVSSLATAAKEHVATAVLGDDFGEMLVEKQEEDKEVDDQEKKDEDETEDDKKKRVEAEEEEEVAKERKGRRKMFQRKRVEM